jgi:hypothetical protein
MNCGDSTIDGLLAGDVSVKPLYPGADVPAVGYLQDLLRGHGCNSLPDPRAASWGVYGSATGRAIADYRGRNGLTAGDQADSGLLRDLVSRPAPRATLGPVYVPLVLDLAFTPILKFVWLTSLFETGGAFQRLNLNTDQCGLSFGILQWSQKSGQFNRFLQACCTREPAEWTRIMGSDSGDSGDGIIGYTAKPNGGIDARGLAVDPAFELTRDPWRSRLQALGSSLPIQRVQLDLAAETYRAELARAAAYASKTTSERGFAFLLDLANQFGPGRVDQQYKRAAQPGAAEAAILQAMEDAFTAIARPQFQPQVRARREFFRTTPLLSNQLYRW